MDTSASKKKSTSKSGILSEDLDAILKFGAENLFKEDDPADRSLREMNIDEILERAEEQKDIGSFPAEELLNSFKVASFQLSESNKQFWSQLEKEVGVDDKHVKIESPSRLGGRTGKFRSYAEDLDPTLILDTRRSAATAPQRKLQKKFSKNWEKEIGK